MPGSKRRRRIIADDDDVAPSVNEIQDSDVEVLTSKFQGRRQDHSKSLIFDSDGGEGSNDDEGDHHELKDDNSDTDKLSFRFSSQAPESTQEIGEVKEFERNNLEKLSDIQREKVLSDLTRLVLFKALAGDAIDRTKCMKEAGINDVRISSAAFDEVNTRLKNMFDFELKRQPEWMNKVQELNSAKYTKDRYYLVNALQDERDGSHSRVLHSVHNHSSIEKGLLMVILAFAYCKGDSRNDGSRWILDKHLYQLLNKMDENIPADPPAHGSKKNRTMTMMMSQASTDAIQTPDVDSALEKFCKRDYLLKEKATEDQLNVGGADVEEGSVYYSMGPRAAIEIGRKQVIYFCAEILDEEPDPSMLAELDDLQDDEEMGTDEQ